MITVDYQMCNLGDSSYSLRLTRDQPTWQPTIQRKNAQATVSRQNPLPPKAVS
jgi:hypothetical protein